MCNCEFDVDPNSSDENTPETTWHFRRTCVRCTGQWWGLHCPHDGYQNPCPHCGKVPFPVDEDDTPISGEVIADRDVMGRPVDSDAAMRERYLTAMEQFNTKTVEFARTLVARLRRTRGP